MKRTSTEKPYLSWCLVVRNCESTLEATLKSLRERTPEAELVIVDTCSSDGTIEIAQRYADVWEQYTGPRGDWNTEMIAVDDMASARQRSFELASGSWRGWADGDDRLVGPEEAIKFLELNGQLDVIPPGYQLAKDAPGTRENPVGLEEFLRWVDEHHPDVDMINAPYLYQRDGEGHAIQWLERERLVRWSDPSKFEWAEAAHEVLVPKGSYLPKRALLAHLLWVHEKKFTQDEVDYSIRRHCKIMLDQYEAGDVTFRRCRYLSNFAIHLMPERALEFHEQALAHAFTPLDQYRALIGLGDYSTHRGLRQDARRYYAAAIDVNPSLPDAYYAAGQAAFDAEDWDRAALMLRKGVACQRPVESEVNPREHALKWPSMLSLALQRVARTRVAAGLHEDAAALLLEAAQVSEQVLGRPEARRDLHEATALYRRARNAYMGQRAMVCIRELWTYLRNNDEPQKALSLLKAVPWNSQDHPIAVELELWSRKIVKHVEDGAAYDAFYAESEVTGYVAMPRENYKYEHAHERVKWLVDWVQNNRPEASVLDLGCCDGITGLPLLEKCPGIRYHGVDVSKAALDNFQRFLDEELGPDAAGRVELEHGRWPSSLVASYDVVIVGEIVEHVQDPVEWLSRVGDHLKPGGVILLTTPWGSFDLGHPPAQTAYGTPRDDRGHLRAYDVRTLVEHMEGSGLEAVSVGRVGAIDQLGPCMVAVAKPARFSYGRPAIACAVAGALWDWNGSSVDREGIGASEELIVRLGERLVRDGQQFSVFGPAPEPEVYNGVGYYEQQAIRKVVDDCKILVSRAPGFHRKIDEWTGRPDLPMVLWLQDTHYFDLTPEVAERYESIVCVSEWHRRLTAQFHGVPIEKIRVAYNWADPAHFASGIDAGWEGLKQPHHFIYASSPDRGLIKLLQLWPRILDMYPDATLSIFYGWRGAAKLGGGGGHNAAWNQRYLTMRREYEKLRHQKGVQEVGMVSHLRIAMEFQRASVWAYPTAFHETCCTNAVKARAAGAVPVTSALAALRETAACEQGVLVDAIEDSLDFAGDAAYQEGYDELFLEGVRKAVDTSTVARQVMAREALDKFGVDAVMPVWQDVLR